MRLRTALASGILSCFKGTGEERALVEGYLELWLCEDHAGA
jgi:hypothetical protein